MCNLELRHKLSGGRYLFLVRMGHLKSKTYQKLNFRWWSLMNILSQSLQQKRDQNASLSPNPCCISISLSINCLSYRDCPTVKVRGVKGVHHLEQNQISRTYRVHRSWGHLALEVRCARFWWKNSVWPEDSAGVRRSGGVERIPNHQIWVRHPFPIQLQIVDPPFRN